MADEKDVKPNGITKDGKEIYGLTGDFNDEEKGLNFDRSFISFRDGNFQIRDTDLLKAAAGYAEVSAQLAKEQGIDIRDLPYMKGADIDGKNGASREENAAYFLALSMADPNNTKTQTTFNTHYIGKTVTGTTVHDPNNRPTVFDNKIEGDDINAALKDPERVAALARQIFYDNKQLSGLSEQSAAAKATDIDKISKSGTGQETNNVTMRC